MKKNTIRAALVAGCLMLGAVLPAQAAQVKWNLEDVSFTDGATGSGSFTIDTTAQTWSAFSITTSAGPSLSGFTYDPTNSGLYFNGFGPNSFSIIPGDGHRYITFSFLDALTDAGGTHAINTASSWECMNCAPWRNMAGSVTSQAADVPEPATMAMVLPALGMLGFMSRRRKKQAAL